MVIERQLFEFAENGYPSLRFPSMLKKNTHEHWTRVTRSNPSWVSDSSKQVWSSVVPRVFSLCSMAAAGEKTLAHSRNHVTDSSTDSGNFFKIAAKIKSERIWVQGLETGEKQTKWRQRQTRKKLKICKNALKGHRNTAEWYILFSVPWPSLVLSLNVLAYTALYNCLQLNFSTPASFHCFLFFCLLWVSKVPFSSFVKGGAFSNRERSLFHARNFKNGPLKPGNCLSWRSKLCHPNSTWEFIDSQTEAFINYRQLCYRPS